MIPRTAAASVRAQNVVIEEPLEAPTKVFIDSENSNEIVCVDTVDMGVQEEHVVQNSEVHDDRIIRCVGAPVKEIVNDRVSSSGKKSDIGLWHGHEVKSEFVCLLDHIINKYPETFEHFATKNKELCTMKLNMLCTTVNNFIKIPMTEPLLSELHAIDCHIDDAKSSLEDLQFRIVDTKTKLQNLQTLRDEKMEEIQKAFGTMGTSLAVGNIGDDLLPGP
ncbi:hypothetical protein POM88_023015 [Heracleum sosnowskyi]|uniref:Uncharacterized protein n=1 Tax=Heracleum sosnowskyi TaxID=360622 RepID=A0AAD8IGF5_9APIA|nr:hypothetical protein POM88_023015 [Heracleum sosnowskyi]